MLEGAPAPTAVLFCPHFSFRAARPGFLRLGTGSSAGLVRSDSGVAAVGRRANTNGNRASAPLSAHRGPDVFEVIGCGLNELVPIQAPGWERVTFIVFGGVQDF